MDATQIAANHAIAMNAVLGNAVRQAWDAGKADGPQETVVRAAQELTAELEQYPDVIQHNDHRSLCPRCQIQPRIDALRAALGKGSGR